MTKRSSRVILIFSILFVMMLACNFSPEGNSDDRDATVQSLSTSVAATTTAIAVEVQTTPAIAQPQATVPPVVEVPAPAVPQATEDLQATQAAGQALAATEAAGQALAATEAAIAPLKADLARYGVDPQRGQLAWVHPPLRLEIDQYMGRSFGNNFPTVIVQDFLLSADIVWDTEYGAAGCAFVFRSDGNQSKPNQYMVWMTRLTNGRVDFMVFAQGQLVGVRDFYANGIDAAFDGGNGATNNLTVVGRGNQFKVYTNGELLGSADPNAPIPPLILPAEPPIPANISNPSVRAAYEAAVAEYRQTISRLKSEYNNRVAIAKKANKNFPAGIVAMGAMAESGRTMCEFNNAYLWLIAP